ncbi:alpha/beta hydrolase [Planomicrobium okeanokoites]|uniref:Alpha/beta hydrolase n=1 Tax=Planomicrobium okeanokoites TaxID=244 RepID=A0ABV7KGJ2_PLAOK|nr:alpha/beta fold hydrolase [Planomicrobium okeanokoites]TAA68754.1 alpha/beta fold hydrolase [Planomicrobium okeanokoites]
MKIGVLMIHGFTGGPFEVQPFADYIEEKTDWMVKIPTLPGHGETLDLRNKTAESWMMAAELALKELKKQTDKVMIVGFSMGGLIAMYLAMRYKIEKIVLLSAAVKYISAGQMLEEIRLAAADAVKGQIAQNPLFHLYEYKLLNTPVSSAFEFLRVVKMVEPYYDKLTLPVCIVQGKKDGIVPLSAAEHIYNQIGSVEKEIYHSDNGKHLICYSDDCEEWFAHVLAFMAKEHE